MEKKRDERQIEVISLDKGRHLVLASAGCGKTDILAERARRAISRGIDPGDMLCLTFTNRASRGMRARISMMTGKDSEKIFIGNIHRFCSKFIYDNNIISQSSAIMDEDDSLSVINSLSNYIEDTNHISPDVASLEFDSRKRLTALMQLQHLMMQYRLGHPRNVITGNVSDYADNEKSERFFSPQIFASLCREAGMDISIRSLLDIYDNAKAHIDSGNYSFRTLGLLRMMHAASLYERYKTEHDLVDFDDLLIYTYNYLRSHADSIRKYSWIQVDEVQDLNPIQFAIIDMLTATDSVTIYLGDEQQAIFSFIGAKLSTLEYLKERCGTNIHHLDKCYRSPKYLLDIFNDYASLELDTDADFLPRPNNYDTPCPGDLKHLTARTSESAATCAAREAISHGNERTAILVSSNRDADLISAALGNNAHFKISGTDLFSLPQTKLLLSHLNVLVSDINHLAWARILYSLKITEKFSDARKTVMEMKEMAMTPSDFLRYSGSSYVLEFMKAFSDRDVVIFDTETTGLDIYDDDIVQIAATRYERGIPESSINILLHTDRDIPPMLGDIENPLIAEYASRDHLGRADGLRRFIEFAKGATLLGHNVDFDYNILSNNCKRDLPDVDINSLFSEVYDSLKLARLLYPSLRSYKLRDLLIQFGLEGNNSHLADEDIAATYSLVKHCHDNACKRESAIRSYLQENAVTAQKLRDSYGELYKEAGSRFYVRTSAGRFPLVEELRKAYSHFLEQGMQEFDKFEYICRYLESDVLDRDKSSSLYEDLTAHVMDLNTYKEADICDSNVITETIFVSTVHKAKGLEFDNVIVYGCVDGTYPFFGSRNDAEAEKEDARKLYVALTRAKRRLCLIDYDEKIVTSAKTGDKLRFQARISPFIEKILRRHEFENVHE